MSTKRKTNTEFSPSVSKVSIKKTVVEKNTIKSIRSSVLTAVKKPSKKQILILAAILVLLVLYFAKGLFIVATVDGQPISRLSVINELEKQGGKNALDSIITKTLIQNEAKKKNIAVNQKDVDDQIKSIQTQIESQGSTLDKELAAQRMTKTDLMDQVGIQLLLDKLVGKDVTVTGKEISDYIATNQSQLSQGESDATISAQVKQQLMQQKLKQKAQDFIQSLRDKAKINYFVNY